jgi:hypothetical protein
VELPVQFDRICPSQIDVVFSAKPITSFPLEISKIGRSMPIVVEIDQISDRGSSRLTSTAEISDGLPDGTLRSTEEVCVQISGR